MVEVATGAIVVLAVVVFALSVLIVLVRATRRLLLRHRARLAERPRLALLEFVAEAGAEGADELVAMPRREWRAAEPGAIALLGKVRGEAHTALVDVFARRGLIAEELADLTHRSRVRRARAAEALGNLEHRPAVPALCALLDDPHAEVRLVAVRALGRIGDPAAASPLLDSLARADPTPSQLVAQSLAQLGPDAEPALSAALGHPEARVRVTALDALGLVGSAVLVEPVARVLEEDPSLDVRRAAANTLGRMGGRAAVPPLVVALGADHPDPLRAVAARALGEAGAAGVADALAGLLDDPAYRVAHEAAHALRRAGPAGLAALREAASPHAAEALAAAEVGGR
ncbi:HEAT repeat domain-containing protein [Catenuloplanes indicus]|uniref:HEAT repeat protein n=1 Tax=Catenuloplanes indicus TaxID=137267 RepID=A0AAE4AW29_9ACTN|nr:HEAT repeat domain-containing protein [Catenuloplanes indicus]MDQ0365490.1 HEAT repeat protein [Catenuloplanes indicus]